MGVCPYVVCCTGSWRAAAAATPGVGCAEAPRWAAGVGVLARAGAAAACGAGCPGLPVQMLDIVSLYTETPVTMPCLGVAGPLTWATGCAAGLDAPAGARAPTTAAKVTAVRS